MTSIDEQQKIISSLQEQVETLIRQSKEADEIIKDLIKQISDVSDEQIETQKNLQTALDENASLNRIINDLRQSQQEARIEIPGSWNPKWS